MLKKLSILFDKNMYRNRELNYLYDFFIPRGIKLTVNDRLKFADYCESERKTEIVKTVFMWILIISLLGVAYFIGGI